MGQILYPLLVFNRLELMVLLFLNLLHGGRHESVPHGTTADLEAVEPVGLHVGNQLGWVNAARQVETPIAHQELCGRFRDLYNKKNK